MARVEFNWPARKIRKITGLPYPKRIEQPESWLNAARKGIKEIPRMGGIDNWEIFTWDATVEFVRFELRNNKDEKCYVVIDRTKTYVQT